MNGMPPGLLRWFEAGRNSFYRSTVCYSPFPTHSVFLHTCLKPLNVMLKVTASSDNDHKIQTYMSQCNHSDFLGSYINSEILDLKLKVKRFVDIQPTASSARISILGEDQDIYGHCQFNLQQCELYRPRMRSKIQYLIVRKQRANCVKLMLHLTHFLVQISHLSTAAVMSGIK